MNTATWLAIFGAFLGGVVKGWLGESRGDRNKLDKLAPKDRETERNRKAREKVKSEG